MNENISPTLVCKPVTPERRADFERLFESGGSCAGCWCMWWRITRTQFNHQSREEKRQAMLALIEGGTVPGLLGYVEDKPVGWVSVAPREDFPSLNNSRVLGRVDDLPVWSIVCFVVAHAWRKKGLMLPLIQGAVAYAAEHGARIVEAYPQDSSERISTVSRFVGVYPVFVRAGFEEVARRSETRPIMRLSLPAAG